MNRMILTLAVSASLGLLAGTAFADPGGFAPPKGGPTSSVTGFPNQLGGPGTLMGAGQLPPGRGPDMYGFAPCIKKLFHRGSSCGNCYDNTKNPLANPANWAAGGYGNGGPAYNPNGFPAGAYGPNGGPMQGTLAFPNHPFVRAPRDYFMLDLNK